MNIFEVIFKNSIIYKIFAYLLFLYEQSYLKDFCSLCAKVYYNSTIYAGVDKYMNSTPLYKYSLIKTINEKVYLLIVNNTEWLYNFVDRTFKNSFTFKFCQKECNNAKNDIFKNIVGFFALFNIGMMIGFLYVGRHAIVLVPTAIVFLIMFIFSDLCKRIFFQSFCYNTVDKLLKVEVSNEEK